MNRQAFLDALQSMLGNTGVEEQRDILNYFSDLIVDKANDRGCSEEEVIAGLGSLDDIAAGLREDLSQDRQTDDKPNPRAEEGRAEHSKGRKTLEAGASAVHEVQIRAANCAISVLAGNNEEEVALQYDEDEYLQFDAKLENGRMELIQREVFRLGPLFQLRREPADIVLTLPAQYAGSLDARTRNSRLRMEGVEVWGDLKLQSSNAALEVRACGARSADLTTSNGRIVVDTLQAKGFISLHTSNGRIEADRTSSGERVSLRSSNGRLRFSQIGSPILLLKTSNGAIEGTLAGRPCDYSIRSGTSNGKNSLKGHSFAGERVVEAHTSNGAIRIDFEEG